MKTETRTIYTCEYCLTGYDNPDDCNTCEASHRIAESIIEAHYKRGAFSDKCSCFPDEVVLKFSDGSCRKYFLY